MFSQKASDKHFINDLRTIAKEHLLTQKEFTPKELDQLGKIADHFGIHIGILTTTLSKTPPARIPSLLGQKDCLQAQQAARRIKEVAEKYPSKSNKNQPDAAVQLAINIGTHSQNISGYIESINVTLQGILNPASSRGAASVATESKSKLPDDHLEKRFEAFKLSVSVEQLNLLKYYEEVSKSHQEVLKSDHPEELIAQAKQAAKNYAILKKMRSECIARKSPYLYNVDENTLEARQEQEKNAMFELMGKAKPLVSDEKSWQATVDDIGKKMKG